MHAMWAAEVIRYPELMGGEKGDLLDLCGAKLKRSAGCVGEASLCISDLRAGWRDACKKPDITK